MRKKISILINSIAAGGAERVVSLLLTGLQNEFDIHLVLLYDTIEYDIPAGQKIFHLHQSPGENGLLKLAKLPLLAIRYKRFCRKHQITTSLSFLKRANYINCLAAMSGLQCRIIISERTYLSNYLRFVGKTGKLFGSLLTKKLYPHADLIITNAALIKHDLEKNFSVATAYKVINNPIDLELIRVKSEESVDDSLFGTFTFISVGGFRPEKNYELLIAAFNTIKDLNCKLLLIGKGESEKKLRGLVKQLRLETKVLFAGFDKNPYKFLSRADCFVLSSDFEGFPNSVQEALACKLPVIATDCQSGPREILAPGTDIETMVTDDIEIGKYGILVPVKNADLLGNAMRLVYTDKGLRDMLKGRAGERAADFDIAVIAEKFKHALLAEQGN